MAATDGVVAKLLYVVVVEDDAAVAVDISRSSFRYTRSVLQGTLQLMGCKPRHAFKVDFSLLFKFISGGFICSFLFYFTCMSLFYGSFRLLRGCVVLRGLICTQEPVC